MANYSIFKVNDDYIVAETEAEAVAHHMEAVGSDWYPADEEPEVEVVPNDRKGKFERADGRGYDEMTFGEWLDGFEYKGPQLLCWNE